MSETGITTLFLDVGGVLLTNGWDRHARARASERFGLDHDDFDERHHQYVRGYEAGKYDIDEYLTYVVFHKERTFTREAFRKFMFAQSEALPGMKDLMLRLKGRHGLKVCAVSNESRELTEYRIRAFGLMDLFDVFVASCFAGVAKPDLDIYRLALDVTQVRPDEVVYLDDRSLFIEVGRGLGLHGIHHTDIDKTRAALANLGLDDADDAQGES